MQRAIGRIAASIKRIKLVCIRYRRTLDLFSHIRRAFLAGVNQTEKPEFHPLRVTPCATTLHSDAMLDIRFERDQHEVPHSLFRVFDAATGQVELTYRVNFDELELQKAR